MGSVSLLPLLLGTHCQELPVAYSLTGVHEATTVLGDDSEPAILYACTLTLAPEGIRMLQESGQTTDGQAEIDVYVADGEGRSGMVFRARLRREAGGYVERRWHYSEAARPDHLMADVPIFDSCEADVPCVESVDLELFRTDVIPGEVPVRWSLSAYAGGVLTVRPTMPIAVSCSE